MKDRVLRAGLPFIGALALSVALAGCAHHSKGIIVESVNVYGAKGDLANSVANGDGFIDGMTPEGDKTWKILADLPDNTAPDTGFIDPNVPGASSKVNDSAFWDKKSVAISYFTGHGTCTGCSAYQQQPCTSSAACTSPPAGEKLPGTCRVAPGLTGGCCYNTDRFLITNSTLDQFQGFVNYSNGFVKWGESEQSGAWAQAGTNGGTNLVVLDISCGVLPPFWQEQLQPAVAGVHLLATIMPVNGDTANVSNRGAAFAQHWAVNPLGSVAQAWLDTLASLPKKSGGPCATKDYSKGGGHGINGCGCNFVIVFDKSVSGATSKLNYEGWLGIQNDDNDAKGAQHYLGRILCNYDVGDPPKLELP